ncbi:MAG: sensor histidine kinase [Clostridiaceae bacterium]|nr:sensor histidine kinase [Clostridiaceae bacterium]
MRELSLHILDIVNNSIKADSTLIEIGIEEDDKINKLTIIIKDNGKGMDDELLKKVNDPFTTSRTTRTVGLGIPLFKNAALLCGGSFDIKSKPDVGTIVTASFVLNHIDRQPLGDMSSTLLTMITANSDIVFVYHHVVNGKGFILNTQQIKERLGNVPITTPEVVLWLKDYIQEGLTNII